MSNSRDVVTGHWGDIDANLLYDEQRYGAYARAHHVAGHYWGLWRLNQPLGPAGLSLRLPGRHVPATAANVEATAVLIEALSGEFARDLHRLADFGFGTQDLNWGSLRGHLSDCWWMASGRGCHSSARVAQFLGEEVWLREATWHALRDWDEIAALADAPGRGRVLEADEVSTALRWW
ncbi:hypothetical protein ABFT23_02155 [Nocardioides sp. C4-1]|uniref:hypothetical protein n=1 Tax=Nocardioides sp. C4-1 TaxID=3151851 RepID=UPI00326651C3